ncbi:LysR family transcriptional regulator [Cupriavidus basilensis]
MKHIPPIPLLLAFDAVARLRSFHRAAEELSVAHSTVSHRIRELEQRCGVALFARTTRIVTPTPEAERLLGPVRQALSTLGEAFGPAADPRTVRRQRAAFIRPLSRGARAGGIPARPSLTAIALDPAPARVIAPRPWRAPTSHRARPGPGRLERASRGISGP